MLVRFSESQIQQSFFSWVRSQIPHDWRYNLIISTPNQGAPNAHVHTAKLKAEGLKKGFPDISVLIPRHNYHGLFIELKTLKGKPSKEQITNIQFLNKAGHLAMIISTDKPSKLVKLVQIYLNESREKLEEYCLDPLIEILT